MNKKEISEIKKQFTPANCTISKICGCYVDGEKNKKAVFRELFLSLPEEEMFKYFDIFRKALSGSIGKNLINMEFPLESEFNGGTQEALRILRDTGLEDDGVLEDFYDKVIASYEYGENYLILLIHAAYDIPGKASDNLEMFDSSDEVYDYIQCCICPVNLCKPGLSYDSVSNMFRDRIRDWIVEMPMNGFLFPAFEDRSTNIHKILYYAKNGEQLNENFIDQIFGCAQPVSAGGQKEAFKMIIQEALGENCSVEMVMNVQEAINDILDEQEESPDPVTIDKDDLKYILAKSGLEEERLEAVDVLYEENAGTDTLLMVSNIVSQKNFEIKAADVVIKVNPLRMDLVKTQIIDGQKCIVIAVDDHVEVNGINAETITLK